jgi:hypothetical protein
LARTSTSGGRSVGIFRSRTKATEFFYITFINAISNSGSILQNGTMKGNEELKITLKRTIVAYFLGIFGGTEENHKILI